MPGIRDAYVLLTLDLLRSFRICSDGFWPVLCFLATKYKYHFPLLKSPKHEENPFELFRSALSNFCMFKSCDTCLLNSRLENYRNRLFSATEIVDSLLLKNNL